ncbi:MAG: YceI family protein [Bacteroidales bacterium]
MIRIAIAILLLLPLSLFGQRYLTKNGKVSFFSKTPIEDIEAHNNQVNVALNFADGTMAFRVLIKSFTFEKALMQQHFNENYMESDKYPNSVFNGKIKDYSKIDLSKNGLHNVEVSGDLTIHGVTKQVTTKGTIEVKGNAIIGKSEFIIKLKDYNVKRPKAVAEEITIAVNFEASKL